MSAVQRAAAPPPVSAYTEPEVQRALVALTVLEDYVSRHPEPRRGLDAATARRTARVLRGTR